MERKTDNTPNNLPYYGKGVFEVFSMEKGNAFYRVGNGPILGSQKIGSTAEELMKLSPGIVDAEIIDNSRVGATMTRITCSDGSTFLTTVLIGEEGVLSYPTIERDRRVAQDRRERTKVS